MRPQGTRYSWLVGNTYIKTHETTHTIIKKVVLQILQVCCRNRVIRVVKVIRLVSTLHRFFVRPNFKPYLRACRLMYMLCGLYLRSATHTMYLATHSISMEIHWGRLCDSCVLKWVNTECKQVAAGQHEMQSIPNF